MARKRANSPGDLWSHQVFTREIAVRALYESLETGGMYILSSKGVCSTYALQSISYAFLFLLLSDYH